MSHDNDPSARDAQDRFEIERRGYNREQVDDFIDLSARQATHVQGQLSRALAENKQLRSEIAAAQQAAAKPAHEQVSERIAQILKLADDEAQAQKSRTSQEATALLAMAQQDAEASRAKARAEAKQTLAAARDDAQQATTRARAEAEATVRTARDQGGELTTQARQQADSTLTEAQTRAKRTLDEAAARAAAIHDGAEQRLQALTSRHTETMRELTAIRDSVTILVADDTNRGSLDEEVAAATAAALSASGQPPERVNG